MRALRSYTGIFGEGGQELFTYEFGFLCFRTIILLVQVDILTRTNTLDSFVSQNTYISDPNSISLALSTHASQLILGAAENESFRKWLFGSSRSQSVQESAVGIESADFSYFCKALWRGRLEFTQICNKFRSTGWSFVLLLLGECLRFTFEDGADHETEWRTLRMICFRHILVAPSDAEVSFLTNICTTAEMYRSKVVEESFKDASINAEDASLVMESFIRWMKPSSRSRQHPLRTAELVVAFMDQDETMTDLTDLLPQFFGATYSWIWRELVSGNTKNLSETNSFLRYIMHTVRLTTKSYRNAGNANTRTIVSLTNALSTTDFVNLLGRLALAPLVAERTFDIPTELSRRSETHKWDRLVQNDILHFTSTYRNLPTLPDHPFAASYFDWLKTWRVLEVYHADKSPWLKNWVTWFDIVWKQLGEAFGYGDRALLEQVECAYARCPGVASRFGARFACNRCREVAYCSLWCQRGHWLISTPGSHRVTCFLS
ncbi:hypothetical protein FS749_009059 [Ceratobasidium sp. UAMH 11750]|nr:hypothetical protein FS749_009059 [Ceratobasidium sp. UAMH 11750]